MGMQPPAPPPGASDDPHWRRDTSPYARDAHGAGPGPQDAPPGTPPPSGTAPPGYGPPPGWGAAPPWGGAPPPGYRAFGARGADAYGAPIDHPQGTTVLVLGILSLVACGLLGPVAWVMGSKALHEIDLDPTRYRNRGNVVAGRVLGIISSALLIVSVVAVVGVVAILIAAAGN